MALTPQVVTVGAHATRMLELDTLVAGLPGLENQAGGLRVQYNGSVGTLMVVGGLVNEREGYSANIPFWLHDLGSSDPAQITYASVGMRVGSPSPSSGFPGGTKFVPYAALRNTTSKPLTVTPVLHTMAGSQPVSTALPNEQLNPFETRQLDFESLLQSAGLDKLSGSVNLSLAFTGHGGDLVVATGSVDQTGTYVFEVEPQGVGRSFSKEGAYWKVADGFDTVYSLWNPTRSAQDYLVTFYYGNGSGKYKLPVHLEAQASTTIDMAALIAAQLPDAEGNVIPPNIREGSVIFASAKGMTEWMTLVVASGTFNVQTATCVSTCISCCGFSSIGVGPAGFICPSGGNVQCDASAVFCDGTKKFFTAESTWSSSDTTIATVGNGASAGLVSGFNLGAVTITAQMPTVVIFTGQVCSPNPTCSSTTPGPSDQGGVKARVAMMVQPSSLAATIARQGGSTQILVDMVANGLFTGTVSGGMSVSFSTSNPSTILLAEGASSGSRGWTLAAGQSTQTTNPPQTLTFPVKTSVSNNSSGTVTYFVDADSPDSNVVIVGNGKTVTVTVQ